MARLTYNERFTNVKKYDETGAYTGLQIASKLNQKNGQNYKLIDAIDIDWNGMWSTAANAYINDTYELIETIDNIADLADLEWIRQRLNELTEDVDLIMSTYVTKTELEELLALYEHALEPGEHITINSENIISTYDLLTPEEADEKFTSLNEFHDFESYIYDNYYTKLETREIADYIAKEDIQNIVVKNADERYDDLEKISYWILQQPEDITGGLEEINARVNRLDEVVGYAIYDEVFDTYTYTGMIEDVNTLFILSQELERNVETAMQQSARAERISIEAYNTSEEAYNFAYVAYEVAMDAGYMAIEAYEMAYRSVVTIGQKHEIAYFTELTEEDIAILTIDPYAFTIYAIREDNFSGIPEPESHYNPEYEGQYYKYIPEVESTGFYRDLEELTELSYAAKYSADNALFRLYTQTLGTSYMNLSLSPTENDGSNTRFLKLNVTEAYIDSYSGEVVTEGIITNSSLSDTLSYISSFVIIPGRDD